MKIFLKIIIIKILVLTFLLFNASDVNAHCDLDCVPGTICHRVINGNQHCPPPTPLCSQPCYLDTLNQADSTIICAVGNYHSIIITLGGCQYKVEMCHKCLVSHPGTTYVKRISPLPGQNCAPINPGDLIHQATEFLVNNPQFIWNSLCPGPQPGPGYDCYSPFTHVWFYSKCWKNEWMIVNNEQIPFVTACEGSSYCERIVEYCQENNTIIIKKETYTTHSGTDCEKQWFEELAPGECYIYPYYPCSN